MKVETIQSGDRLICRFVNGNSTYLCSCDPREQFFESLKQGEREAEDSWRNFLQKDKDGLTTTITMREAHERGII